MSREVRRVPLSFEHPTEPNPYWREQEFSRIRRGVPASRLHAPEVRFKALFDDYQGSVATWEKELADIRARRGHSWEFNVEYHLTGFQGQEDSEPTVRPFYTWADDETEVAVTVEGLDHLHELLVAQKEDERPDPSDYMPVFDVPEDELGWCLYETVSEGTPCTPVFATAEELIDHLATVGQDWDQEPLRREAAERLVWAGGSFGSMAVVGSVLYDATKDADRLAEALSSPPGQTPGGAA